MGAAKNRSTGGGRHRVGVGLGRKEKGGIVVSEGKGIKGEEGGERVGLRGKEAKGSGNSNRGSKTALNTLKETPTNRCNPLSFKVRIPPRAPGAQEVLDLEVGEEA